MVERIILFAGISGITVFIGGVLSRLFNHHIKETPVKYEITHTLVAFSGGIVLSAIAFVLIPKGMEELPLMELLVSFLLGAIVFYLIDKSLAKKGGKIATLLTMLMDFIPESIALGAVFAEDFAAATLIAIFIRIQNLPEAFNSYRDLVLSGFKEKTTLLIYFFLSFFGIAGALTGHFFLSYQPQITAHLMVFASGGILYLLFQDIIPESKLKGSYSTSLGATFGFIVGIIGEKIL